jgi:regulatory protein
MTGEKIPFLSYKEALMKAQNYCAYQERCHKEIREKLTSWKIYGDEREQIIASLIQENFVNEERFAKAYAGGKFRVKKWGRNKIRKALHQRDISAYCITKGMEEISEQDYTDTLLALLQKKNKTLKEKNPFTRKGKLAKFVIGKGYESQLVWDHLRSETYLE